MRAALVALLLLCGAAAAVAKPSCEANPYHPYDGENNLGGCKKCSADNSTCVECWVAFSLASNGSCIQCTSVPDQYMCASCDGDDPPVCYDCTFFWDESPDTGFYANDDGKCVECPTERCRLCHNSNGTCYECDTGLGLNEDGECQQCKQDSCLRCDGGRGEVCQECSSGYFLSEKGKCKKCPKDCSNCTTDGKTCLECNGSSDDNPERGVYLSAEGTCELCSEDCQSCESAERCDSCAIASTNMTDGSCARCGEHCTTCEPGRPEFCQICASFDSEGKLRWGADPETGECVDCKIEHCKSCQDNADLCDWCSDGWVVNKAENATACTPCGEALPHCTVCYLDISKPGPATVGCDSCEDGWKVNDSNKCVEAR